MWSDSGGPRPPTWEAVRIPSQLQGLSVELLSPMHFLLIILILAQEREAPRTNAKPVTSTEVRGSRSQQETASPVAQEEALLQTLTVLISGSGRAISVAQTPSERVSTPLQVAPGAPPLFSFRYFEGKQRHRYGKLDLVMDDAGH
jgi:hypothetical protein